MSKFPAIARYKDLDQWVSQMWDAWNKKMEDEYGEPCYSTDYIIEALHDECDHVLYNDKELERDIFEKSYYFLKEVHKKRKQIIIVNTDIEGCRDFLFIGTKREVKKRLKNLFDTATVNP